MTDITIKGKTNLFGIEVPNIYGGFSNNQKSLLVKALLGFTARKQGM